MPSQRLGAHASPPTRGEGTFVLGADTVVVEGGSILGKPADADEAADMLRRLSGAEHHVVTGAALLEARSGGTARELVGASVTAVRFRPLSADEIEAYFLALMSGGARPVRTRSRGWPHCSYWDRRGSLERRGIAAQPRGRTVAGGGLRPGAARMAAVQGRQTQRARARDGVLMVYAYNPRLGERPFRQR